MSAMLLMSPKPPVHTLADDLDSFLHVLSWVALRFTSHDLDSKALTDLLTTMFDHSYEGEDGSARGGLTKKMSSLQRNSKDRIPSIDTPEIAEGSHNDVSRSLRGATT